MLVAAILLIAAAVMAAKLLWSLAVHALPVWIGMLAATATWNAGFGAGLALAAGLAAATATLALGQLLIGVTSSPLLRAGVALGFALPAAIAGYHAAHGIAARVIALQWSQIAVSAVCAAIIGASAWLRCLAAPRRI